MRPEARFNISILLSAFAVLLVSILSISSASATHAADHRYHIHGRVYDANGMPAFLVRVTVQDLTDSTVPIGSANTGLDGSFDIVLHIHDSNLGDELLVSVEGETKKVLVQFDPSNHNTERYSNPFGFTVSPLNNAFLYALMASPGGIAASIGLYRLYRRRLIRPQRENLVTKIPGIGRSKARVLENIGIRTIEELARVDPNFIAEKARLGIKEAKRFVKKAKEWR